METPNLHFAVFGRKTIWISNLESLLITIGAYCIGQIQAYFNDDIPEDFWSILAVYVAHASIFSVKWAEKFGQADIAAMVEQCMVAFEDYDYFRRNIPVWYKE